MEVIWVLLVELSDQCFMMSRGDSQPREFEVDGKPSRPFGIRYKVHSIGLLFHLRVSENGKIFVHVFALFSCSYSYIVNANKLNLN